jgi:hypothetical protein
VPRSRMVELYLHSPMCFNSLSTWTTLPYKYIFIYPYRHALSLSLSLWIQNNPVITLLHRILKKCSFNFSSIKITTWQPRDYSVNSSTCRISITQKRVQLFDSAELP